MIGEMGFADESWDRKCGASVPLLLLKAQMMSQRTQ
jgi:hypothetical protein